MTSAMVTTLARMSKNLDPFMCLPFYSTVPRTALIDDARNLNRVLIVSATPGLVTSTVTMAIVMIDTMMLVIP